jgi:hypothetical protein
MLCCLGTRLGPSDWPSEHSVLNFPSTLLYSSSGLGSLTFKRSFPLDVLCLSLCFLLDSRGPKGCLSWLVNHLQWRLRTASAIICLYLVDYFKVSIHFRLHEAGISPQLGFCPLHIPCFRQKLVVIFFRKSLTYLL